MADNLLDKASILLTPTAYNDGSMLSVKPENGDGDFTFSRGSAATRVNAQGLLENVQILSSELVTNGDFAIDSDWNKGTGWSIANGKAVANTTGNFVNLYQNSVFVVGKTYKTTFTIVDYTQGKVRLTEGGVNVSGYQNAVGTYTTYFTASQTALYMQGSESFIGSITNISVKEITDDTDLPRIDYTDGCGSWLLEPQSTNLVTYSEDFSQSSWLKIASGSGVSPSITSNYAISPDGTQNASRVILDAGTASPSSLSMVRTNVSGLSNPHNSSISFYVKSNTLDNYKILVYNESLNPIEVIANNSWQRIELSTTVSLSSDRIHLGLWDFGGILTDSYADVSIWGAQLEEQSYATSYIPTNGSIATRLADVANNSGNSTLINSTEGVLYAEIAALADDSNERYFGASDGTTSNRISLWYYSATNGLAVAVYSGGVAQFFTTTILSNDIDYNKVAIKYKENDFALWVNGTEVSTDTSGSAPIGLNRLSFDRASGANNFYGKTKALAVYKEALTDAQLQSLTTQ